MGQLERVADVVRGDRMFSHDAAGNPIVRDARCECGRSFTQTLLSERFLAIVDRQSPRAMAIFREQIPEFFVPVFCPACERKDIGYHARKDEFNRVPDAPFGERADAAD
jgi:hypothetical protein